MALQLGALREALIDAGASQDKAARASEELAGYEDRFNGIDHRLADVASDIRVLKWGQGVTFAAVLAVLLKLFVH